MMGMSFYSAFYFRIDDLLALQHDSKQAMELKASFQPSLFLESIDGLDCCCVVDS